MLIEFLIVSGDCQVADAFFELAIDHGAATQVPIPEIFKRLEVHGFLDTVRANDLETVKCRDKGVPVEPEIIEYHGLSNTGILLADSGQHPLLDRSLTLYIIEVERTG